MTRPPINVKLIARGADGWAWAAQTPGGEGRWGGCRFLFDPAERDYDWLVVIDDVAREYRAAPEMLACTDEHTLLVTTEPPTITRYGRTFSGHFANVLTSRNEAALLQPSRLHSHTGNPWFCGKTFEQLASSPFPEKTLPPSTVCSFKQQRHPLHEQRHRFTHRLKERVRYVSIYIDDLEEAAATVRELIADPGHYRHRLEPLRVAKRLVLNECNLMAMLDRFTTGHFNPGGRASGRPLYGRKRMRGRHPRDQPGPAMGETRKPRRAPKSP